MPANDNLIKTLLLVDNEQEILNLLKDTLTPHGFTCILANSGDQAIGIIQQVQINLVISDIAMPGMTGTELMQQVSSYWPHILRILITSHADYETVTDAITSGYLHAFIEKPWKPEELVQLVDDTLNLQYIRKSKEPLLKDAIDSSILKSCCSTGSSVAESAYTIPHHYIQKLFNGITLSKHNVVIMTDSTLRITYWNNAARQMFGYSAEEALDKFLELILVKNQNYSDILDEITNLSIINKDLSINHALDLAAKHKRGAVFPIELTASAFQYENDWCVICTIRDITKIKLAESSQRASKEMFFNVVEKNHIGILAVNSLGVCVYANNAAEEIIGKDSSTLLEKDLEYPLDTDNSSELKITRDDGSSVTVEVNVSKTLWNGSFAHLIMLHDISARKQAESTAKEHETKLQQIQKFESLGQMAAGIAHEINTPTQFIGDNTNFLREAFNDIESLFVAYDHLQDSIEHNDQLKQAVYDVTSLIDEIELNELREEIPQAISEILKGVDRVSNIVKSMKYFSHPGRHEKENVDINAAIENAINISRSEWKYDADISTEFDSNLQSVPCISGEFDQAILNMIVNAAHAIKEAKEVDTSRNGEIRIQTKKYDNWAIISISDNGTGIPAELHTKIFDPFFTTKKIGVGTGQGLSLAYSTIVDKLGGHIEVESEIGRGATFTIWLPSSDQEQLRYMA